MACVNNSLLMKEENRLKILSLVREKEQSRADIARSTGLSRAAVTLIVDALIKDGLIVEGEAVRTGVGRRPTKLEVCPDAYVAIGIDLSRIGCNVSYINFASKTVMEDSIPFMTDADSTISAVCDSINHALETKFSGKRILGVGVCCPGPIDSQNGVILNPPGLEMFHGFGVKQAIESRIDLRVLLEKDTNALAVCEKNIRKTDEDIVYLLADHGIGCGVIKDSKLLCSKGGMGCEIGHVTLKYDGERCRCGNVGCAELYASIPAILDKANKETAKKFDFSTFIELVNGGDHKAKRIMVDYTSILSAVCVGAVNLFEPDVIVLGGQLKQAEKLLSESIEQKLLGATLSCGHRKVRVLGSVLGENARAYSAAELVIERYLIGGQ